MNKKNGYFLIEAIVAISVIVVGILGTLGLISRSLSLNRVASDQFIASYLASEGVEVTKNILDSNYINSVVGGDKAWNSGFDSGCYNVNYNSQTMNPSSCDCKSSDVLKLDDVTGIYGYSAGKDTRFCRIIKIENLSEKEIRVNSVVEWTTRGGGSFSVNLEDHFFDWRPVLNPPPPINE
ncbi:hypothetical protein HY227_02150 [Candidatus Wolfebacteria bacterium]|nr:hypothetical protein [Candidatus Wolfebacteria bacterium]